ncbi:1-acyl-sn-glycerol-3-phosphate acyltransferase [Skermania sp. ID1734]|nr:1-acyl-sn-glycerol-3-phosphate acyltransferase [Skermania sp. ID1734]
MVRLAARLIGLISLFAVMPVLVTTPKRFHPHYARAMLRCCGIRLRVIDGRGDNPATAPIIVAGHTSWADVLVLAALRPASFVARADLLTWPVLGRLTERKVIPIDRDSLRGLPAVIATITDRVRAGETVVFFPEATTWCGRAYGSLRPALFQAAIDAPVPVQPVGLRYLDADGSTTTTAAFVGSQTLADSLWRVLRSSGITAEVVLAPPQEPGRDRRELAARCERAVRGRTFSPAGWLDVPLTGYDAAKFARSGSPAGG